MLKFINRDSETWQLSSTLNAPPNFVLFVYGPKSSGKSTLMMKISQMMTGDVLFYDFRARSPSQLFRVLTLPRPNPAVRFRNWLKRKISKSNLREGIELRKSQLDMMEQGKMDPFAPLVNKLKGLKQPVLILDEIQNLKHSGLDARDMSQLLNFLVTMAKRMHVAHTVVVTSDCLFIDEVVKLASLEEASEFLYIGDLPKISVLDWLRDEGMTSRKAQEVYDTVGGRPYDLWVVIQHFRASGGTDILNSMVTRKVSRVKFLLKTATKMEKTAVRNMAKGPLSMDKIDVKTLKWLVENEIAFFDPVNGEVYAISKSMLNALQKL